jgi:hypothetical protein
MEIYDLIRRSGAYVRALPVAASLVPDDNIEWDVPTDLLFKPGAVMGRSSTVKGRTIPTKDGPQFLTRQQVGPWKLQFGGSNTFGFPNYTVARRESAALFAAYGTTGYAHFDALMATRPWDEMWINRIRRLYLVDPSLLDELSRSFLLAALDFQFAHRQALWEARHWLHAPKPSNVGNIEWRTRLQRRDLLAEHLRLAWKAFLLLRPTSWNSAFDVLLEQEPALWTRPRAHCTWVPDIQSLGDVPAHPSKLAHQLPQLHRDEPIRNGFGDSPNRCVEAFGDLAQRAFAYHHTVGVAWAFPRPWGDRGYAPYSASATFLGTPGPEFYTPSLSADFLRAWKESSRVVAQLADMANRTPLHNASTLNFLTGLLLRPWPAAGDGGSTSGRDDTVSSTASGTGSASDPAASGRGATPGRGGGDCGPNSDATLL